MYGMTGAIVGSGIAVCDIERTTIGPPEVHYIHSTFTQHDDFLHSNLGSTPASLYSSGPASYRATATVGSIQVSTIC
jgi:hypothetical protein